MSQIIDDYLDSMRKVRPSGAIAPLQQDVTAMGRSINPMGKPKAVNLPSLGSDRLGMPSGYGEEGTTERDTGRAISVENPVTPTVNYPEHTQYPDLPGLTEWPALPGRWQMPALPQRKSASDYPPYPEMGDYGPSTAQQVSTYGSIAMPFLQASNLLARGINTNVGNPTGDNLYSKIMEPALDVASVALGGFNIYNTINSDLPTNQKVSGVVNNAVPMATTILKDFSYVSRMAGEATPGVLNTMGSYAGQGAEILGQAAPYINLALQGYNFLTADKPARGRAAYNTAMTAMSIANPYFGAVNAVGQAVFGGINMYKRSQDERQQWTWPMQESALRADIKYALDRGQTVDINDVIGRLKQLGMKDDDINTYLDTTNFYAPLAADTNNGVWGGAWEDWRQNKDIILAAGDMSGIEGGASIRDVIMNKTGIKPITNNPDAYTRMVQQRNPNPVYDEVNFQTIDPYINVAETGFRKPIEWIDPFSMPLTDVGT